MLEIKNDVPIMAQLDKEQVKTGFERASQYK